VKAKKILIGISGSIAAYKIPILVRLLIKAQAEVRIVMTPAAKDFVSPLVLSTLSKHNVAWQLFEDDAWENHVMLGRWADIMLVTPASANTIAKMANGLCDNLLLATYLSSTCPVFVAPAMDEDMYEHPTHKNNLEKLKQYGNHIIPSSHGELASGLIGMGRMAEPEEIVEHINNFFKKKETLSGKKALITAGPTYENIDPVRFIGNHSSGKMGVAIADALAAQGCEVYLILGPSNQQATHPLVQTIKVRSANEMYEQSISLFKQMDIAVMSAAVADYTPVTTAKEKIKKKNSEDLDITLTKTKDILKSLGAIKSKQQILVGFALESTNEKSYALKKLKEKKADFIVLNSIRDQGAGFGHDTNKVTIFEKNGTETPYALKPKTDVAQDIVQKIISLLPA
jgi:phosphopantothenoylcysteine decarboxylase / phosphopantothenate---cysteine ligase